MKLKDYATLGMEGMSPAPPVIIEQPTGLLENLADIGTFSAAIATLLLFILALIQLKALRRQVKAGQDAAAAAQVSAEATKDAVRESVRSRADEQAPRVIALMEAPEWPPYIDPHRRGMPGGGEPTLLSTLGQVRQAGHEPFVFDEQRSWLLWFRTRGVLVNEGRGTARVRLDGDARFIEGSSPLIENERRVPVPPQVGTSDRNEYLLRAGDVALFEWGYGHQLGEWADAVEHPNPPNPHGACFLSIVVFDWFQNGVIDHLFIEFSVRPIAAVPGRQGQWKLVEEPAHHMGLTFYPARRTYWSENWNPPSPPWLETYAEWNQKQKTAGSGSGSMRFDEFGE